MKIQVFLFLMISFLQVAAQKKQLCFTIDDMPLVTYGINDSTYKKELMNKLVVALNKNKIPATGFVNEGKLYAKNKLSTSDVKLLERWLDGGLDLGNHTYSHPDFNTTTTENYFNNIMNGEKVIRKMLNKRGMKLKYFRHPFLHTGYTKERSDSLNEFLKSHNYTVAPVTIDDDDYLFAVSYKRAKDKNDTALMDRIGTDYLAYMVLKLKYFEKSSIALFGRNIKHILLSHASLLNADYIDRLAQLFRDNGYEFVSLDQALTDPVYKTPVTVYGRWGISWIDRWAMGQGKKRDFFVDDPTVPDYIQKLAE